MDENDYLTETIISKGTYGTVYKYNHNTAIKIIPSKKICCSMLEILLMYYCKIDCIQTCDKVLLYNNKIGLIQDMALCDLKSFPSEYENFESSNDLILKFMKETIIGLNYIHCSNIIHGDIKQNNILIYREDDGYYAKLTDFGLSRIKHGLEYKSFVFIYKPPEIYDGTICQRSDIWALAITFMFVKQWININNLDITDIAQCAENMKYLLNYMSIHHTILRKMNRTPNIEIIFNMDSSNNEIDIKLFNLFKSMLQYNAQDRPFCSELLSNEIFESIQCKYNISSKYFKSDDLLECFNNKLSKYIDENNIEKDSKYFDILCTILYTNETDTISDNLLNMCIFYLKEERILQEVDESDEIFFLDE